MTQTSVGSIIVVNSQDSPFGSGWELSGWEKVVPSPDGSLLLVDGDGTRLGFGAPKVPGGAYSSPPGDFSTLVQRGDGTFQRTLPDRTVYTFDTTGQLTTIEDTNGNRTVFAYASGHLIAVTDPIGQTTTFGYFGGMVSSITTPDGKTTQLQHDPNGNLTGVVLPDGAMQHYGYDGQHLLTTATDPDGHVSTNAYDFAGRVIRMTNGAGETVQFSSPDTLDLPRFGSTLTPDTAPIAAPQAFVETVTDGNGNVTVKTLNDAYELVSWHDATGPGDTYVPLPKIPVTLAA
jgi:YD repeat-containing protein